MSVHSVYVIGSLRNPQVPQVADDLRYEGFDAFDAWYSAGPEADDCWKSHSQFKGQTYEQALNDYAAMNIFEFDKKNLDRCDAAVLVLPAGRSGHLELGYTIGKGKPGFVLLDDETREDRWDVMLKFSNGVFSDLKNLTKLMKLCD